MPVFQLFTNVSHTKITPDLLKQLSALVARILNKSESKVAVHVVPDQLMTFHASDAPCAVGVLKSIGAVGGELNNSHAKALTSLIKDQLKIEGERMYIEFVDLKPSDIARDGSTIG